METTIGMLFSRAELLQLPGNRWLVVLHGEHDLATSPSLGDVLRSVPRPQAAVIVELGRATFIDSTTLHAILRRKADGMPIVLCARRGSVASRLLDLCAIREHVDTYESIAEALVAVHSLQPEAVSAPAPRIPGQTHR